MNTDFAFQKGLEGLNRWVEKTDVLHIFQLNHAKTRLYLRQRLECRHRRPLSMKGPVQPVHTQGPESAKLARRSSDMLRLLADLQLLRDEGERGLGHFTPPVVDDQGMPAVGHLADFRDGGIFLLLLVGGIGDRYRGGVVFLARDDQEWSTLGILRVDLGFRPRVEVGGGCLEERHARSGHRKRLVQLVRFALVYGVGEGETELLVVQRVAQHRRRGLQRRERQRQHAAERSGINGDRHGGYARVSHHLRDEAAEGMADDGGLPLELTDGVDIVLRHLLDALVGKDLRVLLGRLDGVRLIGPDRRERGVALLFEQRSPAVPTAGEEPEAVYEHDRLLPIRVGAVDFLLFMVCENCHGNTPLGVLVGSIGEIVPFKSSTRTPDDQKRYQVRARGRIQRVQQRLARLEKQPCIAFAQQLDGACGALSGFRVSPALCASKQSVSLSEYLSRLRHTQRLPFGGERTSPS